MRKMFFLPGLLLLAACTPADDTKVIVGTVLQAITSVDGKIVATLTRDGQLYRVYLQGQGQALEKMVDTEQSHETKLEWKSDTLLMLHGVCGGAVHYTQGTGNGYPDPDKEHAIQVGFGCD